MAGNMEIKLDGTPVTVETTSSGQSKAYPISRKSLDIDKTLDCGETFRWIKSEGFWFGIVQGKLIQLFQDDNALYSNLPESDLKEFMQEYLDFKTDYTPLYNADLREDTFATESLEAGRGIRILNQEFWETMVSFLISQQNNIPKIKSSVFKLTNIAGGKLELPGPLWGNPAKNTDTYMKIRAFPTPCEILEHEDEIAEGCSLGYRLPYIIGAARYMSNNLVAYEQHIGKLDSAGKVMDLQEFKGIGPKVANCIALFSLHCLDSFPVDVWVQRIIDQYYGGHIDLKPYGKFAGLMQQFMFSKIRG